MSRQSDRNPFDKTKDFIERYKEDGIIWFLEACDLNVFSIRRAMWQMEQAGWFEHVKAFLIGRPLCFGQDMWASIHIRRYCPSHFPTMSR